MFIEQIPIRVRLTLGHALWMALIFIAIGIGVFRVVDDNIRQSIDVTLMTSAKNIRDSKVLAKRRLPEGLKHWESLFEDFFARSHNEDIFTKGRNSAKSYAQLIDTSGVIQAKTRNIRVRLPVSGLALSRAETGRETFEDFRLPSGVVLRQLTLPIMDRGIFTGELIQVGTPMTSTIQTLKSVRRMLWMTSGIGLAMSVIFGYLLTKWSLKPVARITSAVATLGVNHDFDKRLKIIGANDELSQLMTTFNEMIDRVEDAFIRLRRFSGDVSHELRTPLAVLRGEAELALRRDRSKEEYQEALRNIVKESSQMSHIVEDLLLLARAQGNAITLKVQTIPTADFLNIIQESIAKNFEQRNVRLLVSNEGKDDITLSINYYSVALKNLLLNACKHSAPGGLVELKVRATYSETWFDVTDYGEGIPETALPYVFDTFFRADTARNRGTGGVGIGLSLAKAMITLHRGKLTVTSQLGQGSTFRATLPHQLEPEVNHLHQKKRKSVPMVPSSRPGPGHLKA